MWNICVGGSIVKLNELTCVGAEYGLYCKPQVIFNIMCESTLPMVIYIKLIWFYTVLCWCIRIFCVFYWSVF